MNAESRRRVTPIAQRCAIRRAMVVLVAGWMSLVTISVGSVEARQPGSSSPPSLTDSQKLQLKQRDRLADQTLQLYAQGKLGEAIEAAKAMLAIQRRVLPAGHEDILVSLDWVALLYSEQGNFAAARAARQEALDILRKHYGESHWKVTDARLALEDIDRQARMSRAQRQKLAEATRLNQESVGLYRSGKYAEALELARRVLGLRKDVLGERHPYYATSLNNLAALLKAQGDYAGARPLVEQALAIYKEALGERHPNYAASLNNLAELLCEQRDYAAARPLLEQALAIYKEALG